VTDSPALQAARERYAAALHADRTRRAAQDRLMQLEQEAERAGSRLSRARTELRMEHDEAEEWAGKGFAQLAFWIIGKLDDRREAETRQAIEAAARATDEARRAVDRCVSKLDQASSSLSTAHSWGTYDTWFGGGALASMVKRDHVETALGHIEASAGALRELRHELADVKARVEVSSGLEVPSGAWTFDVWFDNFFSDANMQDRIETTDASVTKLRTELASVDALLDAHRGQLKSAEAALRQQVSAILASG